RERAPVLRTGRARSRARARRAVREWHAVAARARRPLALLGVLRHGVVDRAVRFRRHGRGREIPAARRGHRAMSELSAWAAVPAAFLLIAAGLLSAIGALGFVRLPDFFTRMHPPAMASTLGAGCVLLASIFVSSAVEGRPVVHPLLITVFIVMAAR